MSSMSRKSVLVAAAFSAVSGAYATAQTVPIYSSPAFIGGTNGVGGFQETSVPKTTTAYSGTSSTSSFLTDSPGASVATGSSLVIGNISYPSTTGGAPVADTFNTAAYIITSTTPVRLASAVYNGISPTGTSASSTLGASVKPYAIIPSANLVVGTAVSPTGSQIAAEWNVTTGAISTFGTQNSDTSTYSTTSNGSYQQYATTANSSGVVAGTSYLYNAGANVGSAPVVWSTAASSPVLLPNEGSLSATGGYSGTAFGINSSATIVGNIYNYSGTVGGDSLGTSAIAWTSSGGVYTANVLPTGATYTSQYDVAADGAKAINDAGVIAGYTNTVNGPTAARWTPSGSGYTLQQLNSVGSPSYSLSYVGGVGDVSAINTAGDVVGSASVYADGTSAFKTSSGTIVSANTSVGTRPLLWLAGSSTPIQLQVDGTDTNGTSNGTVGSGRHSTTVTPAVYGINTSDFSVGESPKFDSTGTLVVPETATLWNSSGSLTELNSLIGITGTPSDTGAISTGPTALGGSGFTNLYEADGITDTGWISGFGYYWDAIGQDEYTAAFLINDTAAAVPEPTSLTMLALGGIGLLRRQRRLSQFKAM